MLQGLPTSPTLATFGYALSGVACMRRQKK
jgi:hypothetical protein